MGVSEGPAKVDEGRGRLTMMTIVFKRVCMNLI